MNNEEKNQVEQDVLDETELDEVNGGVRKSVLPVELEPKKGKGHNKPTKELVVGPVEIVGDIRTRTL